MRGPNRRRTGVARGLRKTDNVAEARLWNALRDRRLGNHKFVRQFGIGRYFADFACRKLYLVIELDGSQHIDNPADEIRNRYMTDHGWSVARFPSGSMLCDAATVLDTIDAICRGDIRNMVQSPDFQFRPAAWSDADIALMREAIACARKQMGRTWPNPPVGCVIVKDGAIIATGATGDGGRPHAEEIALDAAGSAAQGATAYVTLEPCGKRSNGGCSCSERLVEAGVARVVYACADPSPFASDMGPARIADAGIDLAGGLCTTEAEILIVGFVHFLATGRPLVAESDTAQGFDAEFLRDKDRSAEDDLKAWGAKGYRALYVQSGNEIALELKRARLLSPVQDWDKS